MAGGVRKIKQIKTRVRKKKIIFKPAQFFFLSSRSTGRVGFRKKNKNKNKSGIGSRRQRRRRRFSRLISLPSPLVHISNGSLPVLFPGCLPPFPAFHPLFCCLSAFRRVDTIDEPWKECGEYSSKRMGGGGVRFEEKSGWGGWGRLAWAPYNSSGTRRELYYQYTQPMGYHPSRGSSSPLVSAHTLFLAVYLFLLFLFYFSWKAKVTSRWRFKTEHTHTHTEKERKRKGRTPNFF